MLDEDSYYEYISNEAAETLLVSDLKLAAKYVEDRAYVKGYRWDNQHQFDALVDLAFNNPESMYLAIDDLCNGMDPYYAFTRNEMDDSLDSRRIKEANMYLYGIY